MLLASKQTSAHTLCVVARRLLGDRSRATRARGEWRAREGFSLTYLPFVARAVVDALRAYPLDQRERRRRRRSSCTGRSISASRSTSTSRASSCRSCATPTACASARSRARSTTSRRGPERKKLTPDDLAGGTFTITNPGASGTWISFPIINQPQVGDRRRPTACRSRCRRRARPARDRADRPPLPDVRPPRARRRLRRRVPSARAGDRRDPRLVQPSSELLSRSARAGRGSSTSVERQCGGAVTGLQRAGCAAGDLHRCTARTPGSAPRSRCSPTARRSRARRRASSCRWCAPARVSASARVRTTMFAASAAWIVGRVADRVVQLRERGVVLARRRRREHHAALERRVARRGRGRAGRRCRA